MARNRFARLAWLVIVSLVGCWGGPTREAVNQPPCDLSSPDRKVEECLTIDSKPTSEVPTIALCELVRNKNAHKGKLVRVHGIFYSDAGDHSLHDPDCHSTDTFVEGGFQVGIAATYWICPEARNTVDEFLCTPSHYYWNKTVDMIAVGRLSDLHGSVWFVISYIEKATPISPL